MGNHWVMIFYYIIIWLIVNIFFKELYISQKTTKFGCQNFGYQIWFCTRLVIVIWTNRNKFQCNFNQNTDIFSQENVFEIFVCICRPFLSWPQCINLLALERCGCNLRLVIFKLKSWTDILSISSKISLRWMPHDTFDVNSALVQVMAWCHQAPSHYLNQCWPRSMTQYGITRPQRVNAIRSNALGAMVV